jgi:hypothetical protein
MRAQRVVVAAAALALLGAAGAGTAAAAATPAARADTGSGADRPQTGPDTTAAGPAVQSGPDTPGGVEDDAAGRTPTTSSSRHSPTQRHHSPPSRPTTRAASRSLVACKAAQAGVQQRSVSAVVEADHDVRGILGADPDVRNGFTGVRVRYAIDADASRADIEAIVAQSQKRSAVFDILTNPTAVLVEVD